MPEDSSHLAPPTADVGERLRHWAAQRPEATAFAFLERGEAVSRTLSYAQLHGRALAIMGELRRRNLAGRPVLLLYPPGLDFIEAFCGCLYSGAIAVPAPHPVNRRAAERSAVLCRAAGAGAVLTVAGLLDDAEVRRALGDVAPDLVWIATDALDAAEDAPVPTRPDAPAFLQFTSGSTGTPKGVIVDRGNLAANQAMIAAAFGHSQASRGVTWLPLFHDMGLVGTVLQAIHLGASCAVMSPYAFLQKPVRWLRAIAQHGATTSGAPSFAYELCLRQIRPEQCEGLDLGSWRVAFCGAEPVRGATLRRFAATFARYGFDEAALFPCYGLAEATLFVSGGPAGSGLRTRAAGDQDHAKLIVVSCGYGWGEQSVAIVDPVAGTSLGDGEVGEIWVAGPSVCRGYWRRPQDTEASFGAHLPGDAASAFLRTGDLGFLRDGELFVTGRLKDLIVVRATKHHPEEIEATIAASHPVLAAGAGAVFCAEGGAEPKVIALHEVAREALAACDPVALARTVAGAVNAGHGFRPDAVLFVRAGSLPRTTSGKVQRHLCHAAYVDGRLAILAAGSAAQGEP